MSFINSYGDPTITTWEVDDNGNKVSVPVLNESNQVIGNKFTLVGFPDEQFRVFIDDLDIGDVENPNIIQFVEINIKEKITEINQFKVDYRKTGNVFVHENLDGNWLNVSKYSSRGLIYLPASRIWTKVDDFGEVIETLDSVVAKIELVGDVIANLDTSISIATILKADLDDNITDGNQLKTDLPPIISNANTSKTNLDNSVETSVTKKSELDGSISSATTKNTELDNSISSANTINNTLSNVTIGTIKKATDINNALNTTVGNANTSKTNLDSSVGIANTSKDNLDSSVVIANTSKSDLDSSTSSANAKKSELDSSISSANTINNILANPITGNIKSATDINTTLSGNISTANSSDTNLKATIFDANTSKGELNTSITNSINAKSNLDGSVSTANSTKIGLDSSITEGGILKGELDAILSGADIGAMATDISNLKVDQHNHTNKIVLDGLSDMSGSLKYNGQDVGKGDMEKSIYDTNNNGKVDIAENSERLGGQLPNYYATQTALNNKVDNSKVLTDVPVNAKFTDTIYTHPTTAGNQHIPTGGGVGQILKNTASGTATWQNESVTPIANNLTTTVAGSALDATQGKVLDDKIGILSTKVSPETPLTTTSQNLSGAVNEVKNNLETHMADYASLFTTNADAKNSIYRGKYLGNTVTPEQYTAISSGTFTDLYIGDYWTIGGVNWRIAAFNYYRNTGDTLVPGNHITIVPDTRLYTHVMNDTSITTGGYTGSKMYLEGLEQAKATIRGIFGAHLLKHRPILCNATVDGKSSGWAWLDSEVDLMSEIMVYGSVVCGESTIGGSGYNIGVGKSQLPLFALNPRMIDTRQSYWLRDVVSAAYFAFVSYDGSASGNSASLVLGVRPAFSIS